MIDAPQIVVPGLSTVAVLVLAALAYVGKAWLAARSARTENRREDRQERRETQTDTARLIDQQQQAIKDAWDENHKLHARIDAIEEELETERRERREERAEYEAELERERQERREERDRHDAELAKVQQRVQELFAEVKTLRAQLHPTEENPA